MLGHHDTGGLGIVMTEPYDLDYKCQEISLGDMIYSF